VPVIAALKGAVIGGGLELAASAHIRMAEESAFYSLPEGQRGLFGGGGGSVRVPRLVGVPVMMDMMLTGRRYHAAEGAALEFSQYVVQADSARKTAMELAAKVAGNAAQTNLAVLQPSWRLAPRC
jgi:(methylthio)acryloyl-CoA hydratase